MNERKFRRLLFTVIDNEENPFHPFVLIHGRPQIGKNVYIGCFSEVNARGAKVIIGDNCDIASFVSLNVADSHKACIGLVNEISQKDIIIEQNVFIGSHSFIKGGTHIGHHSVIGAGTIVEGVEVPPYSLVIGNPMEIKEGYYKLNLEKKDRE